MPYIRSLASLGIRNMGVGLVLAALVFSTCLRLVLPSNQGGLVGAPMSMATYESALQRLEYAFENHIYAEAPQAFIDSMHDGAAILRDVVAAQAPQAFYIEAARYYTHMLDMAASGYLSTNPHVLEGQRELLLALAAMEDPDMEYADSRAFPGFYYIASTYGQTPYIVYFAPAIVIATSCTLARRKPGFLSRAPVSAQKSSLATIALATAGSFIVVALAWLPSFTTASVLNGFGDLDYPVVYFQDYDTHVDTVGGALGKAALLFVLLSALAASLVELGRALTGNPWVGCAIACLIFALPLFPFHINLLASGGGAFLPTTYFDISRIAGWASNTVGLDILPTDGASYGLGVLVCSATLLVVFCSVFIANKVCRPTASHS